MSQITDKQLFSVGLKKAIRLSGMSQREFCDTKICSTVNLSKILNNNAGTSASMRENLAKRANTTVQQIMEWGKEYYQPLMKKDEVENDKKTDYSLSQIISKAISSNVDTLENARNTNELLISANKALQEKNVEYDKLKNKFLHTEYDFRVAVSGFFDCGIKIIDANLKILKILCGHSKFMDHVNGVYCQMYGREICNTDCLAKKVLSSKETEYRKFPEDDCIEIGYPIKASDGTIEKIYIFMIGDDSPLISIIRELEC